MNTTITFSEGLAMEPKSLAVMSTNIHAQPGTADISCVVTEAASSADDSSSGAVQTQDLAVLQTQLRHHSRNKASDAT